MTIRIGERILEVGRSRVVEINDIAIHPVIPRIETHFLTKAVLTPRAKPACDVVSYDNHLGKRIVHYGPEEINGDSNLQRAKITCEE